MMKKPTPSKTTAAAPAPAARHYDTQKLVAEYINTYGVAMKISAMFMGVVLLYFFVFIVYLGARGHEPYGDFQHTFADRIEIDYAGEKVTAPAPQEAGH